VVAFIIAIGILVTIHEFGHYWVARKMGVKVLRFSIGFGKPLWKKVAGEDATEYVLAAIPLGGYVKMLDEREGDVDAADLDRAFNRKSVWARIAIVLAGPLANLILAVFLYWLVFIVGITGVAPIVGAPEGESPAAAAGFESGDKIVAIADRRTPTWDTVYVALLDAILASDGVEVGSWGDWVRIIRASPEKALVLEVQRGGGIEEITLTPARLEREGGDIGFIGARETQSQAVIDEKLRTVERYGPLQSVGKALQRTWDMITVSIGMIGKLFTGEASLKNTVSGPISIAQFAGQSVSVGIDHYINFIALVSISLGIFNLFPVPMLDGGHLVYYAVEAVTGKPVSEKVQIVGVHTAGRCIASTGLVGLDSVIPQAILPCYSASVRQLASSINAFRFLSKISWPARLCVNHTRAAWCYGCDS